MAVPDLVPETIALARGRGDSTLIFRCNNGRENGPYDPNGFAVLRGKRRVRPIRLNVDLTGSQPVIVATFAEPLQAGDAVAP